MSQDSDDSRNNPRQSPPLRRDNPDSPGFGPDYAVPSLIFDEYGELKPAALKAFKPAQPLPVNQGPARFVPAAPVQPPGRQPPGYPTNVDQGQRPYTAPIPAAQPTPAALSPGKVGKLGGFRKGLWLVLGAVVAGMLIGLVLFLVLNKTGAPAPPTNTTPISLGSLFPFKDLTPGATPAVTATTGPTGKEPAGDLDTLYNQPTAQLKNNQFKEAAATLEQLPDKQNQAGNLKHPDVPALLFRAYLSLGDQLNQSPQFADFQESIANYQKAIDTAKTLDVKDRNQQEEAALQARLDTGNLYIKAVTAYNQKDLDGAIKIFSQLYARDQNFRDAAGLYYDSLIRTGDGQFAENLLPEAYQSYGRAVQLKNVSDTRYAQARLASIENQLRQDGKPVPTVPAP